MKKIEKQILIRNLSIIRYMFFSFFLFACNTDSNNSECIDCGNGLIDGYFYKKVNSEDIFNLSQLDISVNIDQCIRYKMDGVEFEDASIVEDCCCTIYN
tara:strand:+ start:1662 stop:1958 length:297 start_codon:yes stop_codon:yes gene_type:complete